MPTPYPQLRHFYMKSAGKHQRTWFSVLWSDFQMASGSINQNENIHHCLSPVWFYGYWFCRRGHRYMKWRNLIFQMVVILLSYSNNRLVKNQFWVGTNWLAETQTMLSGSTNWERPTEEPARGSGGCGGDNGLSDNGRHSRLCPLLSTCVWGGQSSKASRPPTLSFTI